MFTDMLDRTLEVGDTVLVARPSGYNRSGARLDRAVVVRLTKLGVTLTVNGRPLHTPWRSDKFYILEKGKYSEEV